MVINTPKSSITITMNTKSQIEDFLLLENGFYMLQESGSKIILEQSVLHPVPPINTSKSSIVISMQAKS